MAYYCNKEDEVYYYHGDLCGSRAQSQACLSYAEMQQSVCSKHLGGANWITDASGHPIQHLQYLPFGERYIDQRVAGSTYQERFRFTGKEKDEETGYGYFGARYMDYELLTSFISVDRYASKYPSISPYAYCAWNPIKLIDPSGDTVKYTNTSDEAYVNTLLHETIDGRRNPNYSRAFAEKYKDLVESTHNYIFESWEYDGSRSETGQFVPNSSNNSSTIHFTKGDTPETRDPYIGASEYRNLFEETYHAWDFEKNGKMQHKQSCFTEAEAWMFSALAPGTREYMFGNDIKNRKMTFMGVIKREKNPLTVAFMLKMGFPETQNAVGYSSGLYKDLPLCSRLQFMLYGGFGAVPQKK